MAEVEREGKPGVKSANSLPAETTDHTLTELAVPALVSRLVVTGTKLLGQIRSESSKPRALEVKHLGTVVRQSLEGFESLLDTISALNAVGSRPPSARQLRESPYSP